MLDTNSPASAAHQRNLFSTTVRIGGHAGKVQTTIWVGMRLASKAVSRNTRMQVPEDLPCTDIMKVPTLLFMTDMPSASGKRRYGSRRIGAAIRKCPGCGSLSLKFGINIASRLPAVDSGISQSRIDPLLSGGIISIRCTLSPASRLMVNA